ncbi:MAG: acyl-CoA thioesterase [Alphaproteobacteria bacterium]|nr:thioesterase family protein [Alphaproteobacteria bacterium]TAD88733.1 MAG: acyl-CoA thioesterase [Alphaproteobacteria bacterium]
MPPSPRLEDFPHRTFDKLRYADTDRQGHINNRVFSTLFETGRVEMLYGGEAPLHGVDCSFVIARLAIDFASELHWPGTVQIGTRVASVGRSSIRLEQTLFQAGRAVASAESVIVHVAAADGRSSPLTDAAREALQAYHAPAPEASA